MNIIDKIMERLKPKFDTQKNKSSKKVRYGQGYSVENFGSFYEKSKNNRPNGVSSKCPECKSDKISEFVYGLLDQQGFEGLEKHNKGKKAKLTPGGCVVRPERWVCRECKHKW